MGGRQQCLIAIFFIHTHTLRLCPFASYPLLLLPPYFHVFNIVNGLHLSVQADEGCAEKKEEIEETGEVVDRSLTNTLNGISDNNGNNNSTAHNSSRNSRRNTNNNSNAALHTDASMSKKNSIAKATSRPITPNLLPNPPSRSPSTTTPSPHTPNAAGHTPHTPPIPRLALHSPRNSRHTPNTPHTPGKMLVIIVTALSATFAALFRLSCPLRYAILLVLHSYLLRSICSSARTRSGTVLTERILWTRNLPRNPIVGGRHRVDPGPEDRPSG